MGKLIATIFATLALMPTMASAPAFAASREKQMTFQPDDYIVGAWWLYKSVFLENGRIVDRSNDNISHSEGQGYGMFLAVAADDREAFDEIWAWTQRELYVRGDELAAWKWDPLASGHVLDTNNASDGDLLIAWALMRAGRKWSVPEFTEQSRRIARDIARILVVEDDLHGIIMLPAASGFGSTDQPDGPIVNLSYWVFPAIAELGQLESGLPAKALQESGRKLLAQAKFGASKMPSDWLSLEEGTVRPAARFAPNFGYEAVRLPLYAAWASPEDAGLLAAVHERWNRDGKNVIQVVELATGASLVSMSDPGYRVVGELLSCSLGKPTDPSIITAFQPTEYYPSTLHLMSAVAISERYPQCLPNLN